MEILYYVALGLLVGALSGLLGVGGGIVLIPALVLVFGFSQKAAQGTTLLMMVPPIGLFAALEYYRHGLADLKAAAILAVSFALGAWLVSSHVARIPDEILKRVFALFLLFTAGYYLMGNSRSASGPVVGWSVAGVFVFLAGGAVRILFRAKQNPSDDGE